MKRARLFPASAGLALALAAGAAAAQPLPHGSLNQAERGVDLVNPAARTLLSAAPRACENGLCLEVTLDLADPDDPDACGTQSVLEVTVGEAVNICYRLTNHTAVTLNHHTLVDSAVGTLLDEHEATVAPHQTFQYNRIIVASNNPNSTTGEFTSAWTAADAAMGYTYQTGAEPFIDISATGESLSIPDGGAVLVTAPFPITLYDRTSDQLCIAPGGGLYLDPPSCDFVPYINNPLPASNLGGGLAVLPHWDALWPDGGTYVEVQGTAPERQYIVSWHDKPHRNYEAGPQQGITFQIVFDEADGGFRFTYETTAFGGGVPPSENQGGSATVGIQLNTTTATQFSYNTQSLSDGLSLLWQMADRSVFTVATDAELDVGAPEIALVPDPADGLHASVEEGLATTEPLLIGNLGSRDLHWQFTPPSSRSHFPDPARGAIADLQTALDQRAPVPAQAGAAHLRGGDPVPAYALKNGPPPLDYVAFDVLDPAAFETVSSGQVYMFAADFVDDDLSRQFAVTVFDGNSRLFEIDTQTGEATLIGPTGIPPAHNPYGGAWDPVGRQFYISAVDFAGPSFIYTVDLATAELTLVGEIPARRVSEIAIDTAGLMYGVDVLTGQLLAIDKFSADAQAIGATGVSMNFAQGLDFDDQTGTLYLMAYDGSNNHAAYTVDTTTGAATLIGPSFGEVGGFSIARPGVQCDTADTVPWLSYDIDAGITPPDPAPASEVTVGFDADDLVPGTYTANLCVFSNDPQTPRAVLPVALTVTEYDDTIFADGFEAD